MNKGKEPNSLGGRSKKKPALKHKLQSDNTLAEEEISDFLIEVYRTHEMMPGYRNFKQ